MTCPKCGAPKRDDARFCGACGAASLSTEPASSPSLGEAPAMIGREIAGRYRMLAKLGEGGMGAVYRAEQISLKRTVAVKLLRPEVLGNQLLLRRFNAEAEAVAKLNHPNTVNIYDFGQDTDGALFIAMEFIEGRSLRSVVQAEAPLPPRRALAIALQVAASLSDAHAHSIVHRDLKPDNVMLQDRGRERDVARVLDFGIAKLRDDTRATQMQMTQQGDMLGTPQYMAPEQIRAEAIDGRTDIYALGCLLYEMVTGRLPHEATTVLALLSKHLIEHPLPPSQRRPELGLPAALDHLILGAMAKDPRSRPPTMEAFSEQIAALLHALPPDPRGASWPAGGPAIASLPTAATGMPAATPAPARGDASGGYAPPPGAPPSPYGSASPPGAAHSPPGAPLPYGSPLPHGAPHSPSGAPPSPSAPQSPYAAQSPYGASPYVQAQAPVAANTPPAAASGGASRYMPGAANEPYLPPSQPVAAQPPGAGHPPGPSAPPSRKLVVLVVAGMVVLGGSIAALVIADHAGGRTPGPSNDPTPSDAAVVSRDAPGKDEPPSKPQSDPWAGGTPADASAPVPDQWASSAPPEGNKLAVSQGVEIIVPSSFRHGEQAGIMVAMDTRGVMIAAGPIAIATNDPQKLAQYHARTNHLVFESMGQVFIGGVQRPMGIFHGTYGGVNVRHVAVPLIGKNYRVAVMFQFPAQLATDPSLQALALELFTRRIVLP
jgi:serine/threonine protein kinase